MLNIFVYLNLWVPSHGLTHIFSHGEVYSTSTASYTNDTYPKEIVEREYIEVATLVNI